MKKDAIIITTLSLAGITMLSGIILVSSKVSADDSAVDTTTITVPVSCTMSGNIATGQEHSATLQPGTYSGASGSQYENGIGKTTLTTFCNDDNGFSIYAVGFTGDTMEGENHTKLVGTSASNNATITTKVYESTDATSNWSMKVTKVENPSQGDPITYNPQNMSITNSFNSWHTIPDTYTKVAEYKATTGTSTTDTTLGAKVETTYAAYVSTSQPADIYTGKVKYTMVHPYSIDANYLNIMYHGNGFYFDDDPSKTTNQVIYDAASSPGIGKVTKKSYAVAYDSEGDFDQSVSFSQLGGNSVVTIDGAENIHISVIYGAPMRKGGPANNLYIWKGNHPSYTNANAEDSDSITTCGTITATGGYTGAFYASGNSGSQTIMECDIAGDSVTFYDYGNGSGYSTGYYAEITGQGDVINYSKSVVSGTYATPSNLSGDYGFLGWSTDPNATEPAYTDEADVITNVPLVNSDRIINLYAVRSSSPTMQQFAAGAANTTCSAMATGSTLILIDSRDNQEYRIAKLADGKCWMVENLNIAGGTALSADRTDVDSSYIDNFTTSNNLTKTSNKITLPTSAAREYSNNYNLTDDSQFAIANYSYVFNSGNKTNCGNQQPCYSYYSWDAATLGSGRDISTKNTDAPYSICPKGWHLPTTGDNSIGEYKRGDYYALAVAYGADLASGAWDNRSVFYNNAGFGTVPNFWVPGGYNYYYFYSSGSGSGYWSATSDSINSSALYLNVNTGSVGVSDYRPRSMGLALRCVFRD